MIVLAIDTAGADCSAALYDATEDRLIAAETETLGKGHAERLMGMIGAVFAKGGVSRDAVDLVGVTIGPGSFTGIRVGVAAARGFGLALSVPVAGVTTLEALASCAFSAGATAPLIAAIDAKRDEIYAQIFEGRLAPRDEPMALNVLDAKALLTENGITLVGTGADPMGQVSAFADQYDILSVARIAATRAKAPGKAAPLYLRGPDAKPQAGFAIERRA